MGAAQTFNIAWLKEMVPLLNGVTYPDGRWIQVASTDEGISIELESRWDKRNMEDEWTYFTELCRESVPGQQLEVVAGEGGLGTDGIVALIEGETNKPRWVLFIDWSNPFDRIEVVGEEIVAKTTVGTTWTINLFNPERLLCVTSSDSST